MKVITQETLYEEHGATLWHPGSEKPERPVFQPGDRGEVFCNTALLSIEQTSSLLQAILGTRGLHQHDDTTPATVAPCKQQNNTMQRNDYW